MGHEYCGIVEEVGGVVRSVGPGQFEALIREAVALNESSAR
jgi:Zn-dependent alcohol dehydrogenase